MWRTLDSPDYTSQLAKPGETINKLTTCCLRTIVHDPSVSLIFADANGRPDISIGRDVPPRLFAGCKSKCFIASCFGPTPFDHAILSTVAACLTGGNCGRSRQQRYGCNDRPHDASTNVETVSAKGQLNRATSAGQPSPVRSTMEIKADRRFHPKLPQDGAIAAFFPRKVGI